jgi:hypothetical protein
MLKPTDIAHRRREIRNSTLSGFITPLLRIAEHRIDTPIDFDTRGRERGDRDREQAFGGNRPLRWTTGAKPTAAVRARCVGSVIV